MFVKINGNLVNADTISKVDLYSLEHLNIRVTFKEEVSACVQGFEAIELVMKLCPSALEGRRFRWIRHTWAVHNLIGHPLMQLLSFVGQHKLAMKVHEATVPRPVSPK